MPKTIYDLAGLLDASAEEALQLVLSLGRADNDARQLLAQLEDENFDDSVATNQRVLEHSDVLEDRLQSLNKALEMLILAMRVNENLRQ